MIIMAVSLYLPGHITNMLSRAWFYYAGDESATAAGGAVGASNAAGLGVGDGNGRVSGGKLAGQNVLDMLGSL